MPIWGLPGALTGAQPSTQFPQEMAHLFYHIPPNIRETLKLSDGEIAQIMVPEIKIDRHKFARAMAKIAYCQAVVFYGLRGFRRLAITDLILGKYPLIPYFVGCETKNPPPPTPGKGLHMVDLRTVFIGRMTLIVGSPAFRTQRDGGAWHTALSRGCRRTQITSTGRDDMTCRDRLRRVVIVCASFARNLAYYRVGQEPGSSALHAPTHPHASFWRQANGNFLDLCVLEWCKLFGERKGEHGWQQIVADPTAFETGLLAHLGMSATTFNAHIETMRRYRDKFFAHLDSDAVMQIPTLSMAQGSA